MQVKDPATVHRLLAVPTRFAVERNKGSLSMPEGVIGLQMGAPERHDPSATA